MKFCPDCGTKLAGPRKFCTDCKKIYSKDPQIVSSAPTQYSNKLSKWREGNIREDFSVAKPISRANNSTNDEDKNPTKIIGLIVSLLCFFAIFLIPHSETCSSCGGDGVIRSSYSDAYGTSTFESDCYMCGGSGQVTYGFWYGLWFFWFFGFGFWGWIFFWPTS
jgi:hypothetical protein